MQAKIGPRFLFSFKSKSWRHKIAVASRFSTRRQETRISFVCKFATTNWTINRAAKFDEGKKKSRKIASFLRRLNTKIDKLERAAQNRRFQFYLQVSIVETSGDRRGAHSLESKARHKSPKMRVTTIAIIAAATLFASVFSAKKDSKPEAAGERRRAAR